MDEADASDVTERLSEWGLNVAGTSVDNSTEGGPPKTLDIVDLIRGGGDQDIAGQKEADQMPRKKRGGGGNETEGQRPKSSNSTSNMKPERKQNKRTSGQSATKTGGSGNDGGSGNVSSDNNDDIMARLLFITEKQSKLRKKYGRIKSGFIGDVFNLHDDVKNFVMRTEKGNYDSVSTNEIDQCFEGFITKFIIYYPNVINAGQKLSGKSHYALPLMNVLILLVRYLIQTQSYTSIKLILTRYAFSTSSNIPSTPTCSMVRVLTRKILLPRLQGKYL